MVDQLSKDREEHEDAEHLVLQALMREWSLEEDEADEERREKTERKLGVDVRRCSPVLLKTCFSNLTSI